MTESIRFDRSMNLHMVGVLVPTSENMLTKKLHNGRKANAGYAEWDFGRDFPQKIVESAKQSLQPVDVPSALGLYPYYYAEDDWMFPRYNFYVRLYFSISGKVVGYFKSYASDQKHTEIRFHRDDWVNISEDQEKILNPSRHWTYFLHENLTEKLYA